jgi:hypothetical protein
MYTSHSKKFGKEFKAKAIAAIENQISLFKAMPQSEFAAYLKRDAGTDYGVDQVIEYGHRWKDSEHVYQAFIMKLDDRLRQERGPGMMSDGEAKALELMFLLPTTEYMFDIMAKEAIASAAGTDHWYMFEKRWD